MENTEEKERIGKGAVEEKGGKVTWDVRGKGKKEKEGL